MVFDTRVQGIDKVEEIFGMTEGDKKDFLLQLADWDPVRKLKVWDCSSKYLLTHI